MTTIPTAGRAGVDLARRATPKLPDGIELDTAIGHYGGASSHYVTRLLERARALYPTGTLNGPLLDKIRRHYQVSACLTVQSLPLVRAEWAIECDDEDIRDALTSAYSQISFSVHRSMVRALWSGYSPNALVYSVDSALGMIVVSDVRDLDPTTCRPVTDEHGSLQGMIQRVNGILDEDEIPAEATLWIVEGMESGNLYGRSILTAAQDPWSDHAAIRAFHARYLERFGEPVVKTRAPAGRSIANAAEIERAAAAGETPPDPVLVDNVETAVAIGENLRHHSVLGLPSTQLYGADGKADGFAWEVEYLEASRSGGADFLNALVECDRRIARACFVPDLLFTNTDTGAYALGQSHRDVWTASVEGRLDDYSRQITAQLVDRLRIINYGESAPSARLVFAGQADEDRERLWSVAETLIEGGRLPVDVAEIGERLGLPLTDVEDAPADLAPVVDIAAAQDREVVNLTAPAASTTLASVDPVAGLPPWKLPQSFDPPPYRRPLNPRERRVGFAAIEGGMNAAERRAVEQLETVLERERERIERQIAGILRKGSRAEILAALGTLEVRGGPEVSRAWSALMADVSGVALEQLRGELTAYADQIPDTLGAEASALFRSYAGTAAERVVSEVTTTTRLELLNAYTSGVSRAGMSAVVASLFDAYEGSEGKGPRLTTRNLSAKSLNYSRAAAIERGGIPLKGAQYSAILDRRTCDLCARQDELVIPIEHTDLSRFTPPIHHNCRCVWVWITREELDFTPTWTTPGQTDVDRFGGLVF